MSWSRMCSRSQFIRCPAKTADRVAKPLTREFCGKDGKQIVNAGGLPEDLSRSNGAGGVAVGGQPQGNRRMAGRPERVGPPPR